MPPSPPLPPPPLPHASATRRHRCVATHDQVALNAAHPCTAAVLRRCMQLWLLQKLWMLQRIQLQLLQPQLLLRRRGRQVLQPRF